MMLLVLIVAKLFGVVKLVNISATIIYCFDLQCENSRIIFGSGNPLLSWQVTIVQEGKLPVIWGIRGQEFKTLPSYLRDSLRKHPFLLALRRWGRFANESLLKNS